VVSIIKLYYNIIILWDHRRIWGPRWPKRHYEEHDRS